MKPKTTPECPFSGADIFNEITPVFPEEMMVFDRNLVCRTIATISSIGVNAVQRQALANLKIAIDRGVDPVKMVGDKGVGVLFNGLVSRLSFQAIGVLPAVLIRDEMHKKGYSTLATSAASSAYETTVGTFLEIRSTSKTYPIPSVTAAFSHAVVPFFVRNCLGWYVINRPHEGTSEKLLGALAGGLVSSIPDSIGNIMIGKSSEMGIFQSFKTAMKEIATPQGVAKLAVGAPIRAVATMGSAILLSPDAQVKICRSVDYMFAEMQREVIKAMMAAKEKDPAEVPIPDEPGDFLNSQQLRRLRELLELDKTTPSAKITPVAETSHSAEAAPSAEATPSAESKPKSATVVVTNSEEKKR